MLWYSNGTDNNRNIDYFITVIIIIIIIYNVIAVVVLG